MPAQLTYPGVYIEEVPSGVHTINGVSTSDTAFIDFFARGPLDEAVRITSFGDFQRVFGGLDTRSEASYAIQQFFLNGGSVAWVVRVAAGSSKAATLTLQGTLTVSAASPGVWGQNLQVAVDYKTSDTANTFNLVVHEVATVRGTQQVVNSEVYRNLSMSAGNSRYVIDVVNHASSLVQLTIPAGGTGVRPASAPGNDVIANPGPNDFHPLVGTATDDGDEPGTTGWTTNGPTAIKGDEAAKTGLHALDRIAPFIFNILCIPAAANLDQGGMSAVITAAEAYCLDKRAFLIVDIPSGVDTPTGTTGMVKWMTDNDGLRHTNAAVYFPRLEIPDPLNENRPRNVGASGTLAGAYARTDATRGVWKAPAGTGADLRGANLAVKISDAENGALNPLGINALRNFAVFGNLSWGARTLDGADIQTSEWKYIPVRRTALYIEESLFEGSKWIVFEPNDEPLWAQIRLNFGAFMHNLFRQGAFQGTTPKDAYFVKCDKETTTQDDINRGIVNILVGFAPLKPAEFVVIKIQQMAGQIEV